jgi:asparagine synthase (glutamine-hydrolysing)
MCGIAGLLQPTHRVLARDEAMQLVQRMNTRIAHRGPDADGVWADRDGRCVLGQRRLSIVDTSDAGRQPYASGDGRWWLTFNGEIYNFQEIRAELEGAGVRFRGRTDTEVLIEAVAFWGMDALSRLDGMYAFVAYDTVTKSMFLARDPFGEKPLYYTLLSSGVLAFASELQALETLPGFDVSVSMDAVAEVLSFQYIGAPRSIYTATRKLPAGYWMQIDHQGETHLHRYFQFRPGSKGFTHRPMAELADELEELLTASLKRRLFADVPLGAFLSGGVDSSTVCALVRRKLDLPLQTFSMGFKGSDDSEHEIARLFAAHLGTEHRDQLIDPHGSEFLRNIGRVLDEPNADSSCLPTYLLSGFARQHVTVAVSGDGGDELFGGYGRYFSTLDESGRHAAGELPDYRPGNVYYGNRILVSSDDHIRDLFGFLPPSFAAHLGRLRDQLDTAPPGHLLSRMRQSDAANYMPGAVLPKVDRMSMQHSLEVRTPFLNVELARFAERLPDERLVANGRGKLILREIAYRYLPRDLIDMPKKGFGLPMSDWARGSLLNLASEMLDGDARVLPLFGRRGLSSFMERQRSPHGFSVYQLWAVLMMESWLRHHPAKVPDLTEMRPATQVPVGQGSLGLSEVSDGLWLVARGDPDRGVEVNNNDAWQGASPGLKNLLVEMVGEERGVVAAPRHIRLPDWKKPLPAAGTGEKLPLDGATLAFLDEEAQGQLDYDELSKLGMAGVKRVLIMSRYVYNRVHVIDLNRKSLRQRMLHTAALAMQSVERVANRRAFRVPLRTQPFQVDQGARCKSAELSQLPGDVDVDLYDRFMVFEGMRQLPPVQNPHGDIAELGGGRYSVWNKRLLFSATNPSRLYSHPFWVVEKTDKNHHQLQFAPRPLRTAQDVAPVAPPDLSAADGDHRDVRLAVGDKIVVTTHGLPPGGAERQWVYLAIGLKRAGYDVHFVMYDEPTGNNAHYMPLVEASGIPIHAVARQSPLKLLALLGNDPTTAQFCKAGIIDDVDRMARLITAYREIKPKAVYAQLDDPNLYAGLAALLAGVPRVVLSFRNYNPTHFPHIYKPWYQQAYAMLGKSNRVKFTGNFEGSNRDYERWIGLAPGRSASIPNAVSLESFPVPSQDEKDDLRHSLKIEPHQKVIVGAFRLSAEKNPRLFLNVCRRLAETRADLRILLAGVGPLMPTLEEEVGLLGLTKSISFLGRRNDVNVLMSIADLFLLTSDQEGMPNVVLEAQLMGVPVVATDAGGTRDAMVPGVTGLLCPVGDADALGAACSKLLDDGAAARVMGEAGARHVRDGFGIASMAQRYATVASTEAAAAEERALAPEAV